MGRLKIEYEERGNTIDINNIEIVIDGDHPDRVEIYMLGRDGERLEGGCFNKGDFMDVVLKFYNDNF